MTPAINLAKKNKIPYKIHEYSHDPSVESYGIEASEKLGVEENRVFKTLVVTLQDKTLAVGIIPVSAKLNLKEMAKACSSKKSAMAPKDDVERSTGYILGGVSPLGQKKLLQTIIDSSAKNFETIYVSAGKRGLDIELNPLDLQKLIKANFQKIKQ
ncbi:MAG: Cys-tRNA(Pro) deacylase [Arcobacteraceae bacterium]